MRPALIARRRGLKKFLSGFPSLVSPTIFGIGDSITQFGNNYVPIAASAAYARDSAGIITGATNAGNQLYGTRKTALTNMTDTSFEVIARNNYTAGSTLGSTAGGANAVAIYSANTTATSTTANASNAAVIDMERFNWKGFITNLIARFKGGVEFGGQVGHGGANAPFTSQITYAATQGANLFSYMGGTNNAKSGQNAATVFAAIKADLDQIMALNSGAGVPTLVQAIIPLGSANAGYAATNINVIGDPNSPALGFTGGTITTSANYLAKQYCLANPTKLLFVDTFTPLCDATTPSAPALKAAMTADGTHPLTNGAIAMGDAGYAAVSPYLTAPAIVARASTDAGTVVNGHTRLVARGPWVTTTGGNGTTGWSGTSPPGWTCGRTGGSGTIATAIVDPGDGLGLQLSAVCTGIAANDQIYIWPWGNNGITLATLGISATDNAEYCLAVEVSWSGAVASGIGGIALQMLSNSSGLYGQATNENTKELAGVLPDTMSARVLRTGWFQASNSSLTTLIMQLVLSFNAATGSAFTLTVRDVTLIKR